MKGLTNFFGGFLIVYPVLMSLVWIIGAVLYFLLIERRLKQTPPERDEYEGISFLIPCYNEADTVEETLVNVLKLSYPKKEIILINDGSSDNTAEQR